MNWTTSVNYVRHPRISSMWLKSGFCHQSYKFSVYIYIEQPFRLPVYAMLWNPNIATDPRRANHSSCYIPLVYNNCVRSLTPDLCCSWISLFQLRAGHPIPLWDSLCHVQPTGSYTFPRRRSSPHNVFFSASWRCCPLDIWRWVRNDSAVGITGSITTFPSPWVTVPGTVWHFDLSWM